MMKKESVRLQMKRMRKNISKEQVTCFSAQICERLLSMQELRRAETVFFYAAVRGEADLRPLWEVLSASGKTMALPRVRGDDMDFYEVRSAGELVPGAFGIPEPAPGARLSVPASGAVILVPGVAFMENGNRIGMGKGYYDRFLGRCPGIPRIGIAYEAQMTAVWEPEAGDLPMDFIVTEDRIINCDPK